MSSFSFSFRDEQPAVAITLATPDKGAVALSPKQVTVLADTGFSDYLQLDWETFTALNLQQHTLGTIKSALADGSQVTDILASVHVIIPECGIDRIMRCLSSPGYGPELMLVGHRFLKDCHAVIDYPQALTTLSD
jgi:predicted aspartyl protease